MAFRTIPITQINEWVGKKTGTSEWVTVDQDRIDTFADVTLDRQFIHIDPVKAAETQFGGTIAHGFLTLSLLSYFAANGGAIFIDNVQVGINYGFDKVRLMSPVRAGGRVRGHFTLMSAEEKVPGRWAFKYAVNVEIEGEEKPALVAEWLSMIVV